MVYDNVAPFLSMSNNVYKEINSIFNLWDIAFYGNNYDHNVDCVINGKYDKDYKIWKFSDKGLVDGISGFVDLDILYK